MAPWIGLPICLAFQPPGLRQCFICPPIGKPVWNNIRNMQSGSCQDREPIYSAIRWPMLVANRATVTHIDVDHTPNRDLTDARPLPKKTGRSNNLADDPEPDPERTPRSRV